MEVTRLEQKLLEAKQITVEPQKKAQEQERQHREVHAELQRVRAGDQRAPGWAARAYVESLEHQLNDAQQQLDKLRAGYHPSAVEGQLATQETQINEQLEALEQECKILCEAAAQAVAEGDFAYRDANTFRMLNRRLQAAVPDSQPAGASDSELQARCTRAEIKVAALQIEAQNRADQKKEEATDTSAAMMPLHFPALSGVKSGLVSQASPQLGKGLSLFSTPHASPLPGLGRGAAALFAGPVG